MDANQMLLLIIALFLIYHMTSICGDGFNVGSQFVYSEDCDVDIPINECNTRFFKNNMVNSNGEPEYYQCMYNEQLRTCNKAINKKVGSIRCIDQCPSCGDLSKYTLSDKVGSYNKCTKDLDTCTKCIDPKNTVEFSKINLKGFYDTLIDKYSEICPKSGQYTGKPYTECDDTKSKCTSDLQTILTDTMNSSGKCSIQELYKEIKGNGEVTLNCNGNNNINGEEAWLDEALSSVGDGYCKPNNDTWKCNRDIPSYCKNGQCVLTGDTNNKKCGCPKGTLIDKFGNCTKAVKYCPSETDRSGYAGTSCTDVTIIGNTCGQYYAGDLHSGNNKTNFHMCSGTLLCEEDESKPCAIKPKP